MTPRTRSSRARRPTGPTGPTCPCPHAHHRGRGLIDFESPIGTHHGVGDGGPLSVGCKDSRLDRVRAAAGSAP